MIQSSFDTPSQQGVKERKERILVLHQSTEENHNKLFQAVDDFHEILFSCRSDEDYLSLLATADIIIGEPSMEELQVASRLKWLQITWAGTDSYTKRAGFPEQVCLTNMSGVYGETISEYVIGAILMFYRRFQQYVVNQSKRQWFDLGSERTLYGKRVLILGVGDIGTSVAKRLRPFGTYHIGIRRNLKGKGELFDEIGTLSQLDQLLPEADIVIGCLPDTTETAGLFDEKRLRKMKEDALLINVGRGSMIHTDALEKVVEEGHLFGVALDVMDPEPLPPSSSLWEQDNVLITPHIAGKGYGHDIRTENRIYDEICENLKRYQEGKPLAHVVDLKRGY